MFESLATGPLHVESVGSTTTLLLNGYEILGAVLGLFIAYLAYRGYRRNDSRPMLFIAIGFAAILGLPLLVLIPAVAGLHVHRTTMQVLVQTFEVGGLLSIIYALRMET